MDISSKDFNDMITRGARKCNKVGNGPIGFCCYKDGAEAAKIYFLKYKTKYEKSIRILKTITTHQGQKGVLFVSPQSMALRGLKNLGENNVSGNTIGS